MNVEAANVNLLDLAGEILGDQLFANATSLSMTVSASSLCQDCAGMPAPSDPDGFVAFELDAEWSDLDPPLTASGYVHATHCDSLDEM